MRGTAGGAIELVALRAIAAGEEVSYCYGARLSSDPNPSPDPNPDPDQVSYCYGARLSNDDFLLDYGFVPTDNAYDDCSLAWEPSGALLQSACDVAGIEGVEGGAAQVQWKAAALRAQLPAQLEQIRITRRCVLGK